MEIEKKIAAILVDHLGVTAEQIQPGTLIQQAFEDQQGTLGADSLDMIELTMAVEEEFGFDISDLEAGSVDTVGDLVALVSRKLTEKANG